MARIPHNICVGLDVAAERLKQRRKRLPKPKKLKKRGAKTLWTESAAINLGMALIEWLEESKANLFVGKFLRKKGLYPELSHRLQKKYPSFRELIDIANAICEERVAERLFDKEYPTAGVIFFLKNCYHWQDKRVVEQEGDATIHHIHELGPEEKEQRIAQYLRVIRDKQTGLKLLQGDCADVG